MIIYISGDSFLSSEKLIEVKNNFLKENSGSKFNLFIFEEENFIFSSFWQLIKSVSFLAEKKMIIIKNSVFLEKNKEWVDQILREWSFLESSENILIFYKPLDNYAEKKSIKNKSILSDKLLSASKVYFFEEIKGIKFNAWFREKIVEKNLKLTEDFIEELAFLYDGNLWLANLDLDKMKNYLGTSDLKSLPTSELRNLVSCKVPVSVFSLSEAVCSRDRSKTLEIWEHLLEDKTPDFMIVGLLANNIKNLLIIKTKIEERFKIDDLVLDLKLPKFVVNKLIKQAGLFSKADLINFYESLLDLDRKIKTNSDDKNTIFFRLWFNYLK